MEQSRSSTILHLVWTAGVLFSLTASTPQSVNDLMLANTRDHLSLVRGLLTRCNQDALARWPVRTAAAVWAFYRLGGGLPESFTSLVRLPLIERFERWANFSYYAAEVFEHGCTDCRPSPTAVVDVCIVNRQASQCVACTCQIHDVCFVSVAVSSSSLLV